MRNAKKKTAVWPRQVMLATDREMVRKVLDDYCREHGLPVGGKEARKKAQEVSDWFDFGIRRADEMAMMIRPL